MKKYLLLFLFAIMLIPIYTNGQETNSAKGKKIRPALLVIDMQNAFEKFMNSEEKALALNYINFAIDLFRKNGYPVINIRHTDAVNGPKTGTSEFGNISGINVKTDDITIVKTYGDSFNKTDLDKILKEKKVNTVFLCGFNSVGCVISTYVGAFNHDYSPFMIKDALIGHKAGYSKFIAEVYDAVSLDVINLLLENAEK